ncbi:MAG: triose-phosphate isomerase [Acidobacteriota bacterium]|nr:triose-phosphate isomerase [Blastocatellia bacterium]MDW8241249.1 triose-phosphate isomerase [Acidobacteriota bacterium]
MRKPIIVGNWKMYKLVHEAVETVLALKPLVAQVQHCDIAVAPPFTALKAVADRLEGSNIGVAAQDVCDQPGFAARTGEISAIMLRDVGCRYVIIGHSERRQYYGDTNGLIRDKIRAALDAGLRPILCVGETLQQREAGQEHTVVQTQLSEGLSGLTAHDLSRMILAYEPVWAIGTGKTATPEIAQAMHRFIRRRLSEQGSETVAEQVCILYGGSVKPDNIRALMQQPDIDGALVGGASLEASSFAQIVHYMES